MNSKDERILYWVELSRYDLDTAQAMLESERLLYVGFMCHQAIEKIIKAYYVFKYKKNAPYTHKLAFLAKKAGIYEALSEEQQDLLDILEPLNIEARYPSDKKQLLDSLTHKKCDDLIKKTEELIVWTENMLLR